MKSKTILYVIEGKMPFCSLSRHQIGTKKEKKGNSYFERRIFSEEYNRLFIPIDKYELTKEFLDECFNECISENDDCDYNSEYDYESKINYQKPDDYTKFIEFMEKEGYFEEYSYSESKSEIDDYIFDLVNDHLSEFCEEEIEDPYWVNEIKEELEICPKCGYIKDLDDLRELF